MSETVDPGVGAGQSKCPLCGESIPSSEMRSHVEKDTRELRESAVNLIRRNHPQWVEEDGACSKCWEYYEAL
jgi:hypothetical protein